MLKPHDLLPDLPEKVAAVAAPCPTEARENCNYPLHRGEPEDARGDIALLAAAGPCGPDFHG